MFLLIKNIEVMKREIGQYSLLHFLFIRDIFLSLSEEILGFILMKEEEFHYFLDKRF